MEFKPWEGNLDSQTYENPKAYKDLEIVNEVITKIIGQDKVIKKIKDIKNEIPIIKSYFRGLGS